MSITGTRSVERILTLSAALVFIIFAYHFTKAEIESVKATAASHRAMLAKMLERETSELLNRKIDISSRLYNLLSEEFLAYAAVQQSDGTLIARAENYALPIAFLSEVEKQALNASYLKLIPYENRSRAISIVEAAVPFMLNSGRKAVLRLGFYNDAQNETVSKIKFRNILISALILLGFMGFCFIKRHKASSTRLALIGSSLAVMIILYMGSRFSICCWFEKDCRHRFVSQALYMGKTLALPAQRFVDSGNDKELKEAVKITATNDCFAAAAVIKNNRVIFHSDPSLVNTEMSGNDNYLKSLNTDRPQIFKLGEKDAFEAFVPVLKGHLRVATIQLTLREINSFERLNYILNRLSWLFLIALVLLLFLINTVSTRVSNEAGRFINAIEKVTAGDLRQNVFIERDDELGQMAHSFNFMLMSLRERDLVGKGLQRYVSKSIVERTLNALAGSEKNGEKIFAVSLFMYFSKIDESIARNDGGRIFSAVEDCQNTLARIVLPAKNINMQLLPEGVLVVYTFSNRHVSLLRALNAARLASDELSKRQDLPFAPKFTMHALEMVRGKTGGIKDGLSLIGDCRADFKAIARVQDSQEIIASLDVYLLLKDVLNFEQLELVSPEQGRINAYVVRSRKDKNELEATFSSAAPWVKALILRMLKNSPDELDADKLFEWYKDDSAEVRFYVIDAIESLSSEKSREFIKTVVENETAPRVLSRAVAILGRIGSEEDIGLLSDKLRSSDRRVKANAVEALEAIGGKRVYDFLNLLVDENDNRVKANILVALGKYGDLKVFELLSRMIKDPDSAMRASAAFAFGKLGMAQGVEPLADALADKDPSVKRQVVASLTSLKADLELDT